MIREVLRIVDAALAGGVDVIQVRQKAVTDRHLLALSQAIAEALS